MMVGYRSRAAKKNLREGIEKMEGTMSPAARARRDFRLGRPPKPGETLPLHRTVVWKRAGEALLRFRALMALEKLQEKHVIGAIVYIESADENKPHILLLEDAGKTSEDCRQAAFEQLGRDDVIAIGMIFSQFDEREKKQVTFPYQFTGLSPQGIAVLRRAVENYNGLTARTKVVN